MSVDWPDIVRDASHLPNVIARLVAEFAVSTNLEKIYDLLKSSSDGLQFRVYDKYVRIAMMSGGCWFATGWVSDLLCDVAYLPPKLFDPSGDFPQMYKLLGHEMYAEFKIQMAQILIRRI